MSDLFLCRCGPSLSQEFSRTMEDTSPHTSWLLPWRELSTCHQLWLSVLHGLQNHSGRTGANLTFRTWQLTTLLSMMPAYSVSISSFSLPT